MPVILGIDAAWSVTQPSGVALIAGETAGLRLMSVASSYTEFCTGPGYRAVLRSGALGIQIAAS